MTIGATATQCGNAPSAASSSSWTLTSTNTISVGEVGILRVALDNISTVDGDNNEIVSVTGGSGTWSKLGEYTNSQGTAANGVTVGAWLFLPDATNDVGTVFTITLASNRTQKVATIDKWTLGAGKSLRQTTEAPIVETQIDAAGGFGIASYTGLTNIERLYLRALAGEFSTTVSVSATTGFTSLPTFRSSTSSPVAVLGEFRVRTSTDESSDPAFTPVADKVGIFLALEEYNLVVSSVTGTFGNETLLGLESDTLAKATATAATVALLDKVESSSEAKQLSSSFLSGNLQVLGLVANANLGIVSGVYNGTALGLSVTSQGKPLLIGSGSANTKDDLATSTAKAIVRGTESASLDSAASESSGFVLAKSASTPILLSIGLATSSNSLLSGQSSIQLSSLFVSAYAGQETEPLFSSLASELGSLASSGLGSLGATASATIVLESIQNYALSGTLGRASLSFSLGAVSQNSSSSLINNSTGSYNQWQTQVSASSKALVSSSDNILLVSLQVDATGLNVYPILGYTSATLGTLTGTLVGRSGAIYPIIRLTVGPKSVRLLTSIKRYYFTVENTNMQTIPTKYPEEVWLCSLDLTHWVATSSVALFEVEVLKGDTVVDQAALINSNTAQWRLSGGTARSTTVFRAIATMSDGQIFAKEFKVLIGG